jgi:hypothetical protein
MELRQQLEQQLIEKALKDESFRKQLIEKPKEVVEIEFGRKIPDSIKLNVLEEDPQTFYLVLPYIPRKDTEMELTEAELESVSGGTDFLYEACSNFHKCWDD